MCLFNLFEICWNDLWLVPWDEYPFLSWTLTLWLCWFLSWNILSSHGEFYCHILCTAPWGPWGMVLPLLGWWALWDSLPPLRYFFIQLLFWYDFSYFCFFQMPCILTGCCCHILLSLLVLSIVSFHVLLPYHTELVPKLILEIHIFVCYLSHLLCELCLKDVHVSLSWFLNNLGNWLHC